MKVTRFCVISGVLILSAVAGVAIFALSSESSRIPHEVDGPEPPAESVVGDPSGALASPDTGKWVASTFTKKQYVAAVRFATRWAKAEQAVLSEDAKKMGYVAKDTPYTMFCFENFKTWAVHVSGTFSTVEMFHGTAPEIGKVDKMIPVPGQYRDPAYVRLRALLRCGESREPLLLLACGVEGTPITEARFVGPLNTADLVYVKRLAKALHEEEYEDMPAEKAQAFLADHTAPIKVWVGLARLKDLRCCGVAEYTQALDSLPASEAIPLVKEILRAALFSKKVQEALPELLLAEKHGAAKLERILKPVVDGLVHGMYGARERIPRERFLERAREVRASHLEQPRYKKVVAQIEEILAAKW